MRIQPHTHLKPTLASIVLILLGAACSSVPDAPPPAEPPRKPGIDYEAVQARIGLPMDPEDTGFREKKFDACDLGEDLKTLSTPLPDCRNAYFTLIQYQLSCRSEMEPTGIIAAVDLTPIANQTLTYTIEKTTGPTPTNERGQGAIRMISATSTKRKYLKISTGVDYLMVRANEMGTIAVPPNWCLPSAR